MELLEQLKKGVESTGKTAELVHLAQLKFDGCNGCLECKYKGTESTPGCVVKDDLAKYIDKIKDVDAFVIGSPVYWSNFSSNFYKAFEKILFSYSNYDNAKPRKWNKTIKTGLVFSGGAQKEYFDTEYIKMIK